MKKITAIIFLLTSLSIWSANKQLATFAGGCFWCMEAPFEKLDGVSEVISGFSGGIIKKPTYKNVSSGLTKHIEAVQVHYNADKVSYRKLLEVFWVNINPTDAGGQFNDRGEHYTTAIFFHNEQQKKEALETKKLLDSKKIFKTKIVTAIRKYDFFYPAEEAHQNYYKKNLITKTKYKYYRAASGRDDFIDKYWNPNPFLKEQIFVRPSDKILKKKLTPLQFRITRENGTEKPFDNKYWNNKAPGIYVDIISNEALFSSVDKYKSGTGWPSFTRPLVKENIVEKKDTKLFSVRTEVRSKQADSHLGHVFNDGPAPTGLRYCINSAALRFIPVTDLEKEGFSKYSRLFKKK